MRFYRRSLLASSFPTATALPAVLAAGCGGPPAAAGTGAKGSAVLAFGSEGEISVMGADGKGRRQLTKGAAGSLARDPAWSPDGGRIAYSFTPPLPATRGPGGLLPLPVTDVYVMNADGSDQKTLVAHDSPGTAYESPVWTPDGKSLVVTYTALITESNIVRDQTVEIARVSVGGGPRQTLVPNAVWPALSPDARRLAYVLSSADGTQLAMADADGKNQTILVPLGRMEGIAAPRFSPDGKQIVFTAAAPMSPVLVPTQPAAPAARTPTPGGRAAGPGDLLARAFGPAPVRAHGLPMDLFAVPVDGGTPRRLTELGEDSPSAVYSPDGRRLAILSGGGIYVLNADGSGLTSVDSKGGHGLVDWRRA